MLKCVAYTGAEIPIKIAPGGMLGEQQSVTGAEVELQGEGNIKLVFNPGNGIYAEFPEVGSV